MGSTSLDDNGYGIGLSQTVARIVSLVEAVLRFNIHRSNKRFLMALLDGSRGHSRWHATS